MLDEPDEMLALRLPEHRFRHGMLYADRWCSPYLSMEFPGLAGAYELDLEFWNPENPEIETNEVVVRANHRLLAREDALKGGELRALKLPVRFGGGAAALSIRSAGQVRPPAPDARLLGLVIRRMILRSVEGAS